MRGGRDEIGSWCHPPADRRWVPLLLLASRLSFHPRHWRDWRSSVKSQCEPPINGAVVEIVAYLKNKWEKGRFPFSISPIYLLGNRRSFSIFGNEQKKEKKNEQKKKIIFYFFSFSFLFSFSTHTGLVSSRDHGGCCPEWRCEEGG